MVYFDYAANPKVDKEVLDTYYDIALKYFANPNSNHKLGKDVKNLIDKSTSSIAKKLNVLDEEIIYTSGSTETNNLVIKGVCERYKNRGKHIIISALEHNSIMSSITKMQEDGFDVDVIGVNSDGLIDINELKTKLRNDTILVSICTVDSELGIIQPIEEIGMLLKNYPNVIFHTDATQSVGKINIDFKDVDLVTISPHKFYGLNSFGLLIKRKNISLKPQIVGGRSTTVYRSGTPDVSMIVALDKALELALNNLDNRYNYVKELNKELKEFLKKYDKIVINSKDNSIPYVINFSVKGIKSTEFAKLLEDKDIYVSTKTACCPVETPSKIVYAVTNDKTLSNSSIRLSICHLTTKEEILEFMKTFDEIYKELEESGKI